MALGAIDGPDESILGELTDAAITGGDRILLLDESFGVVRVLTSRLDRVRRIGAIGDGPGEFRRPVGIVGNTAGDVTVADARGLRLEHFPADSSLGPG